MLYQIGQIIAWDSNEIPEGWIICDGSSSGSYVTPDLRGKFVRGGDASNPALVGTETGSTTHTHSYTARTGNSPAHTHTIDSITVASGGGGTQTNTSSYDRGIHTARGVHTHGQGNFTVNNNTALHTHALGTTEVGSNIPKYISLLFIMKVA